MGHHPLEGGHLTLDAQQRRLGLPFPLSSLVPTHSWTHGFPTHAWDLLPWASGTVPPMSLSEPPEPLSLLGRPRRTPHRDQCCGPLCSPVAWLAPLSLPAIAAVRHRVAARVRCGGCTGLPCSQDRASSLCGSSLLFSGRTQAWAQQLSWPFLACIAGSGKNENSPF